MLRWPTRAGISLAARDAGRSLAVSSDAHGHEHVAVFVLGVGVFWAQCGKRACARRRRPGQPPRPPVRGTGRRKGYGVLLTIFYWSSGTTPRWPGLGSERSQLCASPSLGPFLVALRDRRARRMTPPASLVLRDSRFGSEPIERSVSPEKLLTAYSRHLQFLE
jgi:hypothetical protein